MPLLKAANGDIPVNETLQLMQAHGFDLVSHSRAQVDAAATRDQMIDVVLHHQSIADQSSDHSCWNRCSANVEAEARKTDRSLNKPVVAPVATQTPAVTAITSSSGDVNEVGREARWEAERGSQLLDVFDMIDTDGDKRVAFTDIMNLFEGQKPTREKSFYVFKEVPAAVLFGYQLPSWLLAPLVVLVLPALLLTVPSFLLTLSDNQVAVDQSGYFDESEFIEFILEKTHKLPDAEFNRLIASADQPQVGCFSTAAV